MWQAAADCNALDLSDDAAIMSQELFVPGLHRLGAFAGIAALATPNPLLIHNTGTKFSTEILTEAYAASPARAALTTSATPKSDEAIVSWITEQKSRLRRAAR